MTLYLPNNPDLPKAVAARSQIVVCFCAAWCDTCGIYQTKFSQLSDAFPEAVFVWADIEEYPSLLGDEDVENFPTILIEQQNQVLFFGTMLPHVNQLERLLQTLGDTKDPETVTSNLPNVREQLLRGQ
jgi:hypothetical protein